MKIIDAHLHFSNIESFKRTAEEISFLDYSYSGLNTEFKECDIVVGIAMGLTESSLGGFPDYSSKNPMLLDLEEKIPDSLFCCVGINPLLLEGESKYAELQKIEDVLMDEKTVGIKIYAGYYPYHVHDKIYHPIYELAIKYGLPVVIHSGDTYSDRGLLKYSHPLNVDELAVMYRKIDFVIAHFGDPWIMDTAEIIRKNYNVYADLSGLIVGDSVNVKRFSDEKPFMDHVQRGLVYADRYDKVLFGSDWPLVQIKPFIEFIKKLIPEKHHENVFYNNALRVFKRLNNQIE
ncbi:MAG: amidohydrolase family protein [Bacillota bacterium]